jgi:hypothetical protein
MDAKQLPECVELDAIRLDRDWTWAQLAAAMKRAGVDVSPRTLHYILKRAPEDSKPLDRTLYKIRKFLKHIRATERRRLSRHKTVAQSAANA